MHRRRQTSRPEMRQFLSVLLAATLSVVAPSGQALTLEKAISIALTLNPTAKQFVSRTYSADLNVELAESEFQFRIQPESFVSVRDGGDSAGFYGMKVTRKNRFGGEFTLRGGTDALIGSGSGERFSVQYAQPLFRRSGRLVNEEPLVRAQNAELSEQRAQLLHRSQLAVQVAETYEAARRLELQLAADENAVKRADSLYKLTIAKERLGRTTRIDTLRVQLQQGESSTRLTTTKEQYNTALRRLAELMGQSTLADTELEEPPLLVVELSSSDEAVKTALANRLDYADVQQGFTDAVRASRIAKQNTKPGLKLVTGYESRNGLDVIDSGFSANQNAWYVRLVADTDTDRRRQSLEYKQSVLRQSQAMEDIRARNLAVAREVEEALASYHRAHQQLDVLEGNFQHAGARLKLARRLFSLGRADGFSVTDAEQAYFNAQSSWLRGRSEASVSGYRLLHTTGTLVEAPTYLKPGTQIPGVL